MSPHFATLPDALRFAATTGQGYVFLDQKEPVEVSYAQLMAEAQAVAGKLQARGLTAGERVALILPTGPAFATYFWAVVLAGGIPCVLPSPTLSRPVEGGTIKVRRICERIRARFLISTEPELTFWGKGVEAAALLTLTALENDPQSPFSPVESGSDEIALI